MAEAVFTRLVADRGVADRFEIDSAGTGDWHIGEPPHEGTLDELRRNTIDATHLRSRQITAEDLDHFDYVVVMDATNRKDLGSFSDEISAHVSLLLEHAPDAGILDMPDPYYVGGFDRVYELVTAGCDGLLAFVCEREGIELPSSPA